MPAKAPTVSHMGRRPTKWLIAFAAIVSIAMSGAAPASARTHDRRCRGADNATYWFAIRDLSPNQVYDAHVTQLKIRPKKNGCVVRLHVWAQLQDYAPQGPETLEFNVVLWVWGDGGPGNYVSRTPLPPDVIWIPLPGQAAPPPPETTKARRAPEGARRKRTRIFIPARLGPADEVQHAEHGA
jgi:hypothetical protein